MTLVDPYIGKEIIGYPERSPNDMLDDFAAFAANYVELEDKRLDTISQRAIIRGQNQPWLAVVDGPLPPRLARAQAQIDALAEEELRLTAERGKIDRNTFETATTRTVFPLGLLVDVHPVATRRIQILADGQKLALPEVTGIVHAVHFDTQNPYMFITTPNTGIRTYLERRGRAKPNEGNVLVTPLIDRGQRTVDITVRQQAGAQ